MWAKCQEPGLGGQKRLLGEGAIDLGLGKPLPIIGRDKSSWHFLWTQISEDRRHQWGTWERVHLCLSKPHVSSGLPPGTHRKIMESEYEPVTVSHGEKLPLAYA